jgi:hypothetical protein
LLLLGSRHRQGGLLLLAGVAGAGIGEGFLGVPGSGRVEGFWWGFRRGLQGGPA